MVYITGQDREKEEKELEPVVERERDFVGVFWTERNGSISVHFNFSGGFFGLCPEMSIIV